MASFIVNTEHTQQLNLMEFYLFKLNKKNITWLVF